MSSKGMSLKGKINHYAKQNCMGTLPLICPLSFLVTEFK